MPVVPVALLDLWGSSFSRIEGGRAMTKPLRRGIWNRVGLVIGPALAPQEATLERLRAEVEQLLAAAPDNHAAVADSAAIRLPR